MEAQARLRRTRLDQEYKSEKAEVERAPLAGVHKLRNLEELYRWRSPRRHSATHKLNALFVVPRSIPTMNCGMRERYSTSSSAGAMTVDVLLADGGRLMDCRAFQPRWRKIPPAALPLAGTFPTSLMRFGSGVFGSIQLLKRAFDAVDHGRERYMTFKLALQSACSVRTAAPT